MARNITKQEDWAQSVGTVFDASPRNGANSPDTWFPRPPLQKNLATALSHPTMHVCLDGPTGSGKTSLVRTVLSKLRVPTVDVQLTKHMGWNELCKEILLRTDSGPYTRTQISTRKAGVGLKSLVPSFSVSSEHKTEEKVSTAEDIKNIADSLSEHDVCRLLVNEKKSLYIDDFERANQEITERVADMCRLLTQTYASSAVKIVIVGTDDICRRLNQANPGLDTRLTEVSIGGLPKPNDAWGMLLRGFNELNLFHPGNSHLQDEIKRRNECIQYVYEATAGLPKHINNLGYQLSIKGYGGGSITATDILQTSSALINQNLNACQKSLPSLTKCIQRNVIARDILAYLFETGITAIHHWSDVVNTLSPKYSEDQIDSAIAELVAEGFLVRTGHNFDVLFVEKPIMAYTFGLAITQSKRFKDHSLVKHFYDYQLALPLHGRAVAFTESTPQLPILKVDS